jgi:PPM family protein phosphatase
MPLELETAGRTHVGMKRGHNEDSFRIYNEENLFIVADGMGGYSKGEVASQLAVDTLSQFFKETSDDIESTWPFKMDKGLSYEENRVIAGVKLANKQIYDYCSNSEKIQRMGTTIVVVLLAGEDAYISHVGDSRVYLWRKGKLRQFTEDHSLLNEYIKLNKLTEEQIKNFRHKNVIVRALGMSDRVKVDLGRSSLQPGDIFLLCSDGLSGMLEDSEIKNIVTEHEDDLERACETLIEKANNNGGYDNITAVLIRIVSI